MKALIVIIAILVIAGIAGSCITIDREDKMNTREYDFKDFTRIEAGGAFKVNIERGDTYRVTVTAGDHSHIRVEKDGDTLVIERRGVEWLAPFHGRPEATIIMPVLNGIDISGASEGTVRNFDGDADLDIKVTGASHVKAYNITAGAVDVKVLGASTLEGDIKARKDARLEVSGASKIELDGSGTNAKLMVYGASRAELADFPLQNASLDIAGASNAKVNLSGKMDANVAGASHLYWSGTPVMGSIKTSGASTLSSR